jgi:hypothetical protein
VERVAQPGRPPIIVAGIVQPSDEGANAFGAGPDNTAVSVI